MEGQIEDLLASLNSGEKRTSEAIEKKMVTTTAKDHSAMDTGAMDSGASKKLRKRKQRATETENESMITSLKKKSTKISEEVEDPLEYYDRVKKRKREQRRERKSRKEVADDEEEVEFEEGEDGKRAVTYQVGILSHSHYL